MSKSSIPSRRRPIAVLATLAALIAAASLAFAQEPSNEPSSKRLDAIEQALKALTKQVQELRQPATEKSKAASPSAAKSAATSEPKATDNSLKIEPAFLKSLNWRSIGPANMGGRITDFAFASNDPSLWWVATASGGLLKTINNGVTLEHQFDHEATVSIGAIEVAPSDSNIVWVGTGEANPRNSVSYGDGVYKSTDGGKTWKNMGLKKTYQTGGLVIHPKDSNVVYVGALGRLYGPNEDRGIFKTADGGQTWTKSLYVDDKTGVIDLVMHPNDPETLIAALWDRQRDGFDSWPGNEVEKPDGVDGYDPLRKWGKGGGLYKTSDGGKTWKKLTNGLPGGATGRIGLDWQGKDKGAIFAIIDCENIGQGPPPSLAYLGAVGVDVGGKAQIKQILPGSPAEKAGLAIGDIVTAIGEKSVSGFDVVLDELRSKKPRDKFSLTVARGGETKVVEAGLTTRPSAGGPGTGGGPGGSRVWLGVTGQDRDGKVTLTQVIADGPAAKAGIQEGDVIVAVDGKAASDYDQALELIRGKEAGDKVTLKIARGNETLEIAVTLEDRPSQASGGNPQLQSDVYMGILGADAPDGGARLTQISEDGPAEKAGLQENDVVQTIDGQKIANYAALTEAIRNKKAGDKIKVTILRAGESKEIDVTLDNRPGGPTRTRPYTFSYFGQTPNIQDQQGAKGYEYGGVYKSTDAGETWERVNSLNTRPMYFSLIRVDPSDLNRVYVLGVSHFQSNNGGVTFTNDFGRGVHADGHALWINPKDGRHMVIGVDGGFYMSYDRGRNWDHINTTALAQFYHVAIGLTEPYWVVGGLQDNGSWGGPAISKSGGVINEDWLSIGGGDGFVCRVDPQDPYLVYYESQNGNISRRHLKTGERAAIRPAARPRGTPPYRFNWNTPFILSNHNSKIFYSAGNYVFRSLDRGNNLTPISPEITLTKRGSATALAESSRNPNVLYAGTDDGALWVTRDGGHEWKDITKNLGLPAPRWVSTIETSRFEDGRVYVCLDGHRSDDDEPYVFISEDFGQTFRSLKANIPWGSTRCLREDLVNQNLLFCGTEFGLWTSLDKGAHWIKLNNNLPTVAVHEVAIHPTNGEIVAATHGRSLWASDISALRQLSADHVKEKIALFKPIDVIRWQSEPNRGRTNRRFTGTNPAAGAQLWYSLPAKAQRVSLRIENIEGQLVRELRGGADLGLNRVAWDLVQSPAQQAGAGGGRGSSGQRGSGQRGGTGGRGGANREGGAPAAAAATQPREGEASTKKGEPRPEGEAPAEPRATQPTTGRAATVTTGEAGGTGGAGRGGRGGGPGGGGRPAPNGTYRVVLIVDGKELPAQTLKVERDPNAPANVVAEEIVEQDLREEQAAASAKRNSKLEGRFPFIDD